MGTYVTKYETKNGKTYKAAGSAVKPAETNPPGENGGSEIKEPETPARGAKK